MFEIIVFIYLKFDSERYTKAEMRKTPNSKQRAAYQIEMAIPNYDLSESSCRNLESTIVHTYLG